MAEGMTEPRRLDAATLEPRIHFGGHRERVQALAFSPDGATLATGSQDSNLRLWDVGAAVAGDGRDGGCGAAGRRQRGNAHDLTRADAARGLDPCTIDADLALAAHLLDPPL